MAALIFTCFKRRCGLFLLCCVLLLSCACGTGRQSAAAGPETPVRTFVYTCRDSYEFVARLEEEKVWLFLPGRTLPLPRVPAASGAKYSDGRLTFWSRGEEALLETGGLLRKGCVNQPARAVWEHAKLSGVDFRAVGQEPGWYLEISGGGSKSVFVSDYGRRRDVFATTEPQNNQKAGKTVYSFRNEEHALTVELEARPCQDSMSGESFETAVTVILDNRTYRGCGRPLH